MNAIIKILNSNLYAMSLYARQIAGTVVLLFIARYLSVYDYGLFSSYKTIAGFILILANLGYNEYILVSSQKVVKDVQLKIGFFIVNAIFLLLFITLGSLFFELESNKIFILVLLRTFFDATFFAIMLPFYQASNKFKLIANINFFYSIVTILIALCAFIFHLSLVQFLYLSIGLGLFNFIQCSIYAKINYFLSIKYFKKLFLKIDKTIFSYAGCTIGWIIYNQLPALYISFFINKELAALYFAAYTISSILFLLLGAQVQKMVPELINSTVMQARQIIRKNLIFIMSLNAIILLFFAIFGKFLLKLIYSKPYYIEAYPLLLLLTFANLVIAFASTHSSYITATGNQHYKVKIQFTGVIVSMLALYIFKNFGIYTPVIAYVLSAIAICISFYRKTIILLKQQEQLENIKETTCNN